MKRLSLLFSIVALYATVRADTPLTNVKLNGSGNSVQSGATMTFQSGSTLTVNAGATVNGLATSAATAPSASKYIIQTADSYIPNAQVLGVLATGLLKNTMATGVLVIASPGTDYLPPTLTTKGDLLGFSTVIGRLGVGTDGKVLTADSTKTFGFDWESPATGSGTVTSVDMTVPSGFLISGNPITASGTLAISYATGQTANKFLATPDGATGAISERSIVTGDLPASGVSAATYGDATHSAQIAVDATGRVISASNVSISGGGGGIGGSTGSTDNALLRADGTGGATAQSSNVTLGDSGTAFVFSGAAGLTASSGDITFTPGSSSKSLFNQALWVDGTGIQDVLFFKGGPGGSGSTAAIAFDATGAIFGAHVSTRINFVDDGSFGANLVLSFRHGSLGTTTTDQFTFGSQGAARFNSYGAGALSTDSSGNITATSDERLKNIQGQFTRGLSDISKIHPILYRWNGKSGNETETTYAGFSAQNVQTAIPEAIGQMKDGYLTIQDRAVIAALVTANQQLYTLVKCLIGGMAVLLVAIIWTRKR